jgi:phospholipase D1/2
VSRATQRAMQARNTPHSRIIQPGKNCWRVDRADRFYCIQDAADHFQLVRRALLEARDTAFIVGWDINSTIDLAPGLSDALRQGSGQPRASSRGAAEPTRLDELLAFIARRRPQLRIYILIWDYGSLYTLEREPLTRWRLRWRMPRQVCFGFDDHHPVGASHHQKIVVVDDRLAFCGGIDLTGHRWDTCDHRLEEPARKTLIGPYDPYHEVQAMVSGPAAASLGVLSRDRWRALGYDDLPPIGSSSHDLWPSDIAPDLTDVDVAISRTMPPSETQPAVRECEALFRDSIARAKRLIYIESQYFTDDNLAGELAARLGEPDGPEIVIVAPKECYGWLEKQTMGAFRDAAFRRLTAADSSGRLRLVYPVASRAQDVATFVHSKVMIVDDELVRIGSANFARRSMGMDTECDVAVEADGDSRVRAGIRHIRDRLLAEHLGLPVPTVAREIERSGSLGALIDARQDADHTLLPIEPVSGQVGEPSAALRDTVDPGEPLGVGEALAQMLPPVDVTHTRSPLRLWILPAIALLAALVTSSAINTRPEFQEMRDVLQGTSSLPSALWMGTGAFVVAGLLLVPLELLTVAAAVAFGAVRGGIIAAIGSLALALVGYLVGHAIGASGVARWVSPRSYRSIRQLGAHRAIGVLVLRMSSVASTGAINLLCGAGRVPFASYMAGTVVGMVPVIVALSTFGGIFRDALLEPSLGHALTTIAGTVLLIVLVGAMRTLLLIRQFAPSVAMHRSRAEFG